MAWINNRIGGQEVERTKVNLEFSSLTGKMMAPLEGTGM